MLMKNGSSGRRGRRFGAMADINVTPLVDVMLVLLIVFMITAPMLTTGVAVDLPKTRAGVLPQTNTQPLTVTINREGAIFIGGSNEPVKPSDLAVQLRAIAGENLERRVFVKADEGVAYGRVAGVLALLQEAGFTKAGLPTRADLASSLEQEGPPAR
jgi:biopolymer transport protein TolR